MEIKKLKNENYEIDKETLEEFLYSYHRLNALECGGVDNWQDYSDVLMTIYQKKKIGMISFKIL